MREGRPASIAAEARVEAPRARLAARVARCVFWAWALVSFLVAASLMLGHEAVLPRPPTAEPALRTAIAQGRAPSERDRWLALHFLYGSCRCSQGVLTSLLARRARTDVSERVVLVGAHPAYERAVREAGFAVEVLEPTQLKVRYGLEAAPVFVVADPRGEVRYVGGYSERKQGLAIRDVAILAALKDGESARELPLFGCAVSRALQRLIDPLSLKIGSESEG